MHRLTQLRPQVALHLLVPPEEQRTRPRPCGRSAPAPPRGNSVGGGALRWSAVACLLPLCAAPALPHQLLHLLPPLPGWSQADRPQFRAGLGGPGDGMGGGALPGLGSSSYWRRPSATSRSSWSMRAWASRSSVASAMGGRRPRSWVAFRCPGTVHQITEKTSIWQSGIKVAEAVMAVQSISLYPTSPCKLNRGSASQMSLSPWGCLKRRHSAPGVRYPPQSLGSGATFLGMKPELMLHSKRLSQSMHLCSLNRGNGE